MALRAVFTHPKFRRLMKLLKFPEYRALGVLETLWHFAGRHTPQGDIGRYPDVEIEAWCGWDGEDGAMIAALVKAGWLDVDNSHRLLVHDFHAAADPATKISLKRSGLDFLTYRSNRVSTPLEQCSDGVMTSGSGSGSGSSEILRLRKEPKAVEITLPPDRTPRRPKKRPDANTPPPAIVSQEPVSDPDGDERLRQVQAELDARNAEVPPESDPVLNGRKRKAGLVKVGDLV